MTELHYTKNKLSFRALLGYNCSTCVRISLSCCASVELLFFVGLHFMFGCSAFDCVIAGFRHSRVYIHIYTHYIYILVIVNVEDHLQAEACFSKR